MSGNGSVSRLLQQRLIGPVVLGDFLLMIVRAHLILDIVVADLLAANHDWNIATRRLNRRQLGTQRITLGAARSEDLKWKLIRF